MARRARLLGAHAAGHPFLNGAGPPIGTAGKAPGERVARRFTGFLLVPAGDLYGTADDRTIALSTRSPYRGSSRCTSAALARCPRNPASVPRSFASAGRGPVANVSGHSSTSNSSHAAHAFVVPRVRR
jgi:hypothetical protein